MNSNDGGLLGKLTRSCKVLYYVSIPISLLTCLSAFGDLCKEFFTAPLGMKPEIPQTDAEYFATKLLFVTAVLWNAYKLGETFVEMRNNPWERNVRESNTIPTNKGTEPPEGKTFGGE